MKTKQTMFALGTLILAGFSTHALAALPNRAVLPVDAKDIKIVSISMGQEFNGMQSTPNTSPDCDPSNSTYIGHEPALNCQSTSTAQYKEAVVIEMTYASEAEKTNNVRYCAPSTNDVITDCDDLGYVRAEIYMNPASFSAGQLDLIRHNSTAATANRMITFATRAVQVSTSKVDDSSNFCHYVMNGDTLQLEDESCIDHVVYTSGSTPVMIMQVSLRK